MDYSSIFEAAGKQYNIDPHLLQAQMIVESGGDPNAYNAGSQASGAMQLIPSTAKALGVTDPTDPAQAIFGAAKLMSENLDRYGNPDQAVLAYHGGMDQNAWGPKTQAYLKSVTAAYQKLASPQNDASSGGNFLSTFPGGSNPTAAPPSADFLSAFPANSANGAAAGSDPASSSAAVAPSSADQAITIPGMPDQGSSNPGGMGSMTLHYGAPPPAQNSAPLTAAQPGANTDQTGVTLPVTPAGAPVPVVFSSQAANPVGAAPTDFLSAFPSEPTPAPQSAIAAFGHGVKNLGRGLLQGIEDVPKGASQFVGHGINSLLQAIAPNSSAAQAFSNNLQQFDQGIQNDENAYQAATPGSIVAGAGRFTGNVLPFLLGTPANLVAQGSELGAQTAGALGAGNLLTKALGIGGGMAGGALTGAGYATVSPVTQSGDYWDNKGAQMGVGALTGGLIPPAAATIGAGAGKLGQVIGDMRAPFTDVGQSAIAQNALRKMALGGNTAVNAAELVPGSVPTLAQATGNPGIAAAERVAQGIAPNEFNNVTQAGQAARTALLNKAMGTPDDIAQATAVRDAAVQPALNAAFLNKQPANTQSVVDTIDSILKGSGGNRDAVSSVLNNIRSKLVNGDVPDTTVNSSILNTAGKSASTTFVKGGPVLEMDPEVLYNSVRKQIGDLLDKRAASSNPAGQQASKELLQVRDSLDKAIGDAAPGFNGYLANYASASKPIGAMQYLQGLNLTDASGNTTLASVDRAIKQITKLRNQPGINPAKSLSDDQLAALSAVRDDLRRTALSGIGRSAGSPTFQNFATNNLMDRMIGPTLGKFIGPQSAGSVLGGAAGLALGGPLGAIAGGAWGGNIGRGVDRFLNSNNPAITNKLIELLTNPMLGKAALDNVGISPAAKNALMSRISPYLFPTASVAGIDMSGRGKRINASR